MDYLRHLSLEKIAPQYWLHEARHRAVGNIESSPRFAPFAAVGGRQADAILESAAAALDDPDLLAMHFWLSWILTFEAYRNAPEYRADYLDRLRDIPLRQRLQYLSSEFKQGRWPRQFPTLPAPLQLAPNEKWALIVSRHNLGVKDLVRGLSMEIAATLSNRFDRVVVALIGPQSAPEPHDKIIWQTIPPGWNTTVDPSYLARARQAVVGHRECRSVRGIVARRFSRWLSRVQFARRAVDATLPAHPPSVVLSLGLPDPECTLIMNKYAAAESAVVTPMVEPVASSRVSFPCRRVFVTGTAQAEAQKAANPRILAEAVGSQEGHNLISALNLARAGDRDPRRTVLILGKEPEASWHNGAVVAAVLDHAQHHGFERVVYRGKPNGRGEMTAFAGISSPKIQAAIATGLLEVTGKIPFEIQLAGADTIISATGGAFLITLLCGVPVMGYCFNPRVDLGEALYLAAIPEADRPVMCRELGAIGDSVERTLARAQRAVGPLPPAIVEALFGDLSVAPAERIAELLAGAARSDSAVEARPVSVGAR